MLIDAVQVYLAFFMQLVPLSSKVQDDIIPVVGAPRVDIVFAVS